MKPREPWTALLDKAAQDEFAADRLAALTESPDEVIGFHLQQAAEKLLKALLCFAGVHYRRTHNLGELIHLLGRAGHHLPSELDGLRDLTPYAVEWRYDFIPEEGGSPLERASARALVSSLRRWVERRIAGDASGS
jgi:HEPN domain-containing protein